MERRWPQNTRAAEAFRIIKDGITGKNTKTGTVDPKPRLEARRCWLLNTQAARTARIISAHFRSNK